MYSLSGCLIREELEEIMQTKTVLYPLKIFFGPNTLQLYALKKEERIKWVQVMKEAIGYANLSDYYEMKVIPDLTSHRVHLAKANSGSLELQSTNRLELKSLSKC